MVVSIHPARLGAPSLTKAIVTLPQLSVAWTILISAAGNVALHPATLISGRAVAVGGVWSTVRIMFCVTVMALPQSSVMEEVLMVVSIHPASVGAPSLTK